METSFWRAEVKRLLEAAGIDPRALERFVTERVYTLLGTDSHGEVFSLLLTGSRAAGIHTSVSDIDIDVLCPPSICESVKRASYEAGIVGSEKSFWFFLRDDNWDRYFGKRFGRPHFSLTSLGKVEEHFLTYDDVPLWIWLNAKVLIDPNDQFQRIRDSWRGYPKDVLVKKIKRHWLLADYNEVDVYPYHHSSDEEILAASTAILNSVNELLRLFFLVEGKPFPYTEKLMQAAPTTKLGQQFAPMLTRVVDLVVGRIDRHLPVWERLDKAHVLLCYYDQSPECRQLDDACGAAMIAAGVDADWVKADYDNIFELLMGDLGPVP